MPATLAAERGGRWTERLSAACSTSAALSWPRPSSLIVFTRRPQTEEERCQCQALIEHCGCTNARRVMESRARGEAKRMD